MAVIVKYVVERNGKEVMTFKSKKEADAYDKQLDIAERLQEFIGASGIAVEDEQLDELTLYMAKYRDELTRLLKGGKSGPSQGGRAAETDQDAAKSTKNETAAGEAENGKPDQGGVRSRRGRPKAAVA